MAKISGVAKKYDGATIDYVQVFNWKNGRCINVALTDTTGNWSTDLYGTIDVGLTYVANGCQPITHGPYGFIFSFDDRWSTVSLLLHLDGSVVDESGLCIFNRVGVTNYGAGIFNKAIELLPTSSSSINGLEEQSDSNPALSFGTGDFTIELFVKPSASFTQSDQALLSLFQVHVFAGWQLLLSSLKPAMYRYDNGGRTFLSSNTALITGEWSHIAACRVNGVVTMYVNGASIGSADNGSNYSSLSTRLTIGYQGYGSATYPFTGMIDEVRVTKGLARYTSNFTPPTEPHPHGHS